MLREDRDENRGIGWLLPESRWSQLGRICSHGGDDGVWPYACGNDSGEKNVKEVVKLNGPIYDENKIKELLNSDVFIQTSRTEGQPLGIMEAISMGIPCILTSGTNLAEDAQKNEFGWKTETKAEGIGKTILTVFNNKELLPQYSKNAIEYANNNFDWENISKKVVEKYKKIISK